MALETEALFLKKAVRAGVLDPEKGTAALYVYSQLKQMGAQFSFAQFLIERGLLSNMAVEALQDASGRPVQTVSQVGDFELIELIGEGQNGVVYRAQQVSLDRVVALKILSADVAADPEALQRFQNEARATAKLNHPNVVQGIDVGSDKGLHYFAMELVEGGSARTLLASSGGKLNESAALRIAQQAAEGLRAAHAAGLVHRDMKPDNILLTPEGQAKLVDLGLARAATRAVMPTIGKSGRPMARAAEGAEKEQAANGEFWASAPYAAPEIIRGETESNPRSDIYSLGATLFELLAGRPPYVGESPEAVLQAHLTSPVPDLLVFRPDVSIQTSALVKRMLAKNPDERVPSAAAVVEAIERLLAAKTQPQTPPKPALHAARPAGAGSGLHTARPAGAASGLHAARPAGATSGLHTARPAGATSGMHTSRPAGATSGMHIPRPAGATSGMHAARPLGPPAGRPISSVSPTPRPGAAKRPLSPLGKAPAPGAARPGKPKRRPGAR